MQKIGLLEENDFNLLMVNFLLTEPFFASIVRFMRKERVTDPRIPTAAVSIEKDGFVLFWNPVFISTLTKEVFFGLMKHECYHVIFRHITIRRKSPHLLWNIATDLAINSLLTESELPSGALRPGRAFDNLDAIVEPQMAKQATEISSFIQNLPLEKTAEWYMSKLLKTPGLQESLENYFTSIDGRCEDRRHQTASSTPKSASSGYFNGPHGFDVHPNVRLSDTERALLEGRLKKSIKEAAARAQRTNGWGSVSTDIKQQIFATMDDSVNWKKALLCCCGTKQRASKSRTFRRISRKYPYIHPGRKIVRQAKLAIYIDQSGSVSSTGISAFFSTLNQLARNIAFTVYHFDTRIDEESRYEWRKNQQYRFPMRTLTGGTCFQAVQKHYQTIVGAYDGCIIMTDGCAPKPDASLAKRCWVLLPGCKLDFVHDPRDAVIYMKDLNRSTNSINSTLQDTS